MDKTNLLQNIDYIDIGRPNNSDIVQWRTKGRNSFTVDIANARHRAKENIFQRTFSREKKTVFIKKRDFVFTIGSEKEIQFQFLESILDNLSNLFIESYGEIPATLLTESNTNGICEFIPDIIRETSEKVKWVRAKCKVCDKMLSICIRRSLIENAHNFPVSLVYFHEGHGLLIYIDANFSVRGAEIVDISG